MIRTILTAFFLAIFLILSIPLVLIIRLISVFHPMYNSKAVLDFVKGGFALVGFLSGTRLTVIGEENVPKDTPVLYVGNHQSYFDIVLTYSRVPSFTGYIAKIEMAHIPFLSGLMKYVNCLFLDRKDLRQGMEIIKAAIEKVKNGVSIFIYPEGTRNSHPDEFLEFHKGSFKIAQRTDCPIVPVTIVGSREIFETHVPAIRAVSVILEYGKPFRFSDLSKEDQKNIHVYTERLLHETYLKNKALLTKQ